MSDLINQTVSLVQKSSELIQQTGTEEIVKTAAKGFFAWLGGIFTKKSAKEKLTLIEESKANAETIAGLKANLEFILEDNEELRNQLEEKVKALDLLLKETGNTNNTKTNTMNVTGNNNISSIDNTGNITINKA
jgi:hypothetical protein